MNEEEAKLFGQGCDARLAGIPLECNPYVSVTMRGAWRRGWL